jgi:hypothetical protein
MVTSRLLQACSEKSQNLTVRQNSSNLVIETHTIGRSLPKNVLAKTRADTNATTACLLDKVENP